MRDGGFGRSVYAHKEKEVAYGGLHLSNINVEEADGVSLELLPFGLVSLDILEARKAMTLKESVQR